MDEGVFFNQNLSKKSKDIIIINYERLYYPLGNIQYYPITAEISNRGIKFRLNDIFSHADISIVDLPFSTTIFKEIDQTIENLLDFKFPELNDNYKLVEYAENLLHFKPLTTLTQGTSSLNFEEMLLDFLFDVFHSNLLDKHKYLSSIHALVLNHPLLHAIFTKADYLFRLTEFRQEMIQTENPYCEELLKSEKRWVEIITSEQTPKLFYESNWFSIDLETELDYVLKNNSFHLLEKDYYHSPVQNIKYSQDREVILTHPISIIEKASDWYLERFNFLKAGIIAFKSHPYNKYILYGIGGASLVYFAWEFGFLLSQFLIVASLYFMFIFGVIEGRELLIPRKRINQAEWKWQLITMVNFLSPKLIITLILSWMSFKTVYKWIDEDYSLDDFSLSQISIYYLIITGILGLYLYHEVRVKTIDLSQIKIRSRILLLILGGYILTALMGLAMHMFIEKASPDITTHFCDLILFTPIVFFIGIFLNLLFKGKRVTGF